ncbi:MAG: GNAT family N-acetyltransferase [Ruminococcus flavefaciens]|nr:GNAT family N-acetyltransferase [Ruminococcus flavefaciens]
MYCHGACCDGEAAGCIGLKKMDELNCKMKRLYVRPQFRKKNNGKLLIWKIILLIVLIAIFYFTPKTFGNGIHPSDVDHINVFDGNRGVGFTIDDPEHIQYIVENIQSHPMKRDSLSFGYMGYSFKISYIDDDEKDVIPVFILNSDNSIRKDPFFYTCEGGLCFDYIENLEKEYFTKIE